MIVAKQARRRRQRRKGKGRGFAILRRAAGTGGKEVPQGGNRGDFSARSPAANSAPQRGSAEHSSLGSPVGPN